MTEEEKRALTDQGREMDEATRARIQRMKEALPSAERSSDARRNSIARVDEKR